MCHHRGDIPDWPREELHAETRDTDDADEMEEEPLPEFLNEEESDHEVLTDGGDEA